MTVIKLLEEISNAYLLVLAEGGIQLALEGTKGRTAFHYVTVAVLSLILNSEKCIILILRFILAVHKILEEHLMFYI
jgi:hypothetical protein